MKIVFCISNGCYVVENVADVLTIIAKGIIGSNDRDGGCMAAGK